jgi:hypothetical protein
VGGRRSGVRGVGVGGIEGLKVDLWRLQVEKEKYGRGARKEQ